MENSTKLPRLSITQRWETFDLKTTKELAAAESRLERHVNMHKKFASTHTRRPTKTPNDTSNVLGGKAALARTYASSDAPQTETGLAVAEQDCCPTR